MNVAVETASAAAGSDVPDRSEASHAPGTAVAAVHESALLSDAAVGAVVGAFRERLEVDDDLEPALRDLLRDVLDHPGRMFRAQLAYLLHLRWGGREEAALDLATSIEYFHSASLLLDDLPAMDDATERRGRTCPHRRFGEASAILGSLGLIHRAYGLVWPVLAGLDARSRSRAERLLDGTLGLHGVLDGQARDLAFGPGSGAGEVRRIAEGKTVSLVRLTLVLPALAAGAPRSEIDRLEELSRAWGLAYQGLDDLRDELASRAETGKTPGRDRELGRPSLALALGTERARREVEDNLRRAEGLLRRDGSDRGLEALHQRLCRDLGRLAASRPAAPGPGPGAGIGTPASRRRRKAPGPLGEAERALAAPMGTGDVLAVEVPVPACPPERLLHPESGVLWIGRSGDAWVGSGEVARISGHDPARLRRDARDVLRRSRLAGDPSAPGFRWFGGLAFDPRVPTGRPWTAFGSGSFVLPRWTYRQREAGCSLFLTVRGDEAGRSERRRWLEGFEEELARIAGLAERPESPFRCPGVRLVAACSPESWKGRVESALGAIRSGKLEKVVLARCSRLVLDGPIDAEPVLRRLIGEDRGPGVVFAFRRRGATFLGRTPERLVRVDDRIRTEALAGTATPATVHELGSPKTRREHGVVVEEIERRLRGFGVEPERGATAPASFGGILHLRTPISGPPGRRAHVLDLASALHPTPAVGGRPGPDAREWIRHHEPGRGWYAGPIGWFDGAGRGEMRVALRCGMIDGDRLWTWAGAGIVEGSDPEAEEREVGLKAAAFLGAVGLSRPGTS